MTKTLKLDTYLIWSISFFIVFICHGCACKKTLVPYISISEYADSFVAKRNPSDTLIVFYTNYGTCMPGAIGDVFFFTKNLDITSINGVSEYGIYQIIDTYLDWSTIYDSLSKIKTEEIIYSGYEFTDSLGRKVYSSVNNSRYNKIQILSPQDSIVKFLPKEYITENFTTQTHKIVTELKALLFDSKHYLIQRKTRNRFGHTRIVNAR